MQREQPIVHKEAKLTRVTRVQLIIRGRKEEENSQSSDRLDDMHLMLSTQEEEEELKKSNPLTASLCNKLTAKT